MNVANILVDWVWGSNCTFMELKLTITLRFSVMSVSSNCTFMELKFFSCVGSTFCSCVLIVPLWN